jgi:serine/threonine-protein kinase PknK
MTEAVSLAQAPSGLPLEVTTFVGRRSERTRIRELMSESRLVTLTGFGGIGKTRLALRMAQSCVVRTTTFTWSNSPV